MCLQNAKFLFAATIALSMWVFALAAVSLTMTGSLEGPRGASVHPGAQPVSYSPVQLSRNPADVRPDVGALDPA